VEVISSLTYQSITIGYQGSRRTYNTSAVNCGTH